MWSPKPIDKIKYSTELRSETREIIDNLYMKILDRHADEVGLVNFGSMLENGKMTQHDIIHEFGKSQEYKRINQPVARKKEIRKGTRKTIDNLYIKVLGRHADSDGIEFFGTMLEDKIIFSSSVRNELLSSFELWDKKKTK